jgi:predicted dehydrogenase
VLRGVDAHAVAADQPVGAEVLERGDDLLGHAPLELADVALVDVDAVRTQPAQGGGARLAQVGGGDVLPRHPAGALLEGVAELGRDHDAVAVGADDAAEDLLAVARAVDVGGVEEGDAELEGAAQRGDGFGVVDLAPARGLAGRAERAADRPAPEPERADIGPAEGPREWCGGHRDRMRQTLVGMQAGPTTFGVIGSGWRSAFFARLARAAPDRLRVTGVVTRSDERAAEISSQWGVPAFLSAEDLLAAEAPDFVIASVPWPATPDVTRELVGHGVRVLAETPPAPDLPGLRALWADVGAGGLVQVAEQYLLMPAHAARLAVVREGVIGEPTSVQVSSTHLYHAVSMMRGLLGVGFEPAVVSARSFTAPLVDPLSFDGWSGDSTPKSSSTTLATLDFGGRMGLYDFTDNQWWNPLRARRIVVRGSHGELVDDAVVRLVDPTTPVESHLIRRQTGIDLNLEGFDLDHISFDGRVVYRNPFQGARLSEDDIGVAALLERTGAWARGEGPEPYPLAEGLQDHLLSLAIEESVATGRDVTTTTEDWAEGLVTP